MLLRNSYFLPKELLILFLFLFTASFFAFNSSYAEGVNPKSETANKSNEKEVIQKTPPIQQGLKVYIDPDTGELISQPEEESQIVQPNNSVFGEGDEIIQKPEEIIHPDGSATVIMPENFQHSTKIKIDENGKQTTECKREHEHSHE